MGDAYSDALRQALKEGFVYIVVRSAWNEGDWIDESETDAWLDSRLATIAAYERNRKEGLDATTHESWSVKRVRLRAEFVPVAMSVLFEEPANGPKEAEDADAV